MDLLEMLIPTRVAQTGMTVEDVIKECIEHNVPGIPFVDESGKVVGRISVRHTFKLTCIPDDLVKGAHLLGDDIEHLKIPEVRVREVFSMPVENFVLKKYPYTSATSPVVKALAIMEQHNSGYVFVMDKERYLGIFTRLGAARLMMTHRDE